MRALPLLFLLLPLTAEAQSLADTHFARNFCWKRTYDREHLAAHPEQTVTQITLGREPPGHPSAPGQWLVEIGIRFRGESREVTAIATCRPDGVRFECGLEGDAGNLRIEADGPDRVVVTTGDRGMVFEGRRDTHMISSDEGDDRTFLLRRCG